MFNATGSEWFPAQLVDAMDHISAQIPYLRRYARALTGDQSSGDTFAAAVLEAMVADPTSVPTPARARVGLFAALHAIWSSAGAPVGGREQGRAKRAQAHLARLTSNAREAVLLRTMEEFSTAEVAEILKVPQGEAAELIRIGVSEMAEAVRGSVLIIEDEPVIAMDIEAIVSEAGHRVLGVAKTHAEAVAMAGDRRPDLILADIRLADDSSGIDAVNDLLRQHGADVPVIFITAYPERLLTGDKPEPAFLITKPFAEDQVLASISQAMFFASTETLA